jgi:hypothetical protein
MEIPTFRASESRLLEQAAEIQKHIEKKMRKKLTKSLEKTVPPVRFPPSNFPLGNTETPFRSSNKLDLNNCTLGEHTYHINK